MGSARCGARNTQFRQKQAEGVVKDLRAELLAPEGYAGKLAEDLVMLLATDVSKLSDRGDLQLVDMLAARASMIQSREKSMRTREEGGSSYKGAEYHMISPNVALLPTSDAALYLMRLKSLQEPGMPKPAKGSVPRAKQELTRWLNLPTRYYIHTLKLEPGKFETLRITREVVLPPAL